MEHESLSNSDTPFSDYLIFVDESGDHSLTSIDHQYPVFVLCFCIIHKSVYINNIIPQIKHLKMQTFGHDQVVLHEHDIRKRGKAFKQLNKEARETFIDKLSAVMDNSDINIIAVVIDKFKHKAKHSDPDHTYHLALQFGLDRLYSFMEHQRQNAHTSHIIFESRGPKEDAELELEFRRVCDGRNRTNSKLPFEIVIAHKQTNSEGLQLADLTARPIGLSAFRPNQSNRALAIIKKKLYMGDNGCIEENGLKIFP